MNIATVLLSVWFGCVFPLFTAAQCNLKIEISGIKNSKGRIMLQLLDSDQKVYVQLMGEIIDMKCNISVKNINPGKYAVRYYHDENLNGLMETNLIGKPTEGYGFSNNVTGKFGAPSFEKWLFEVKSDTKITLKPIY